MLKLHFDVTPYRRTFVSANAVRVCDHSLLPFRWTSNCSKTGRRRASSTLRLSALAILRTCLRASSVLALVCAQLCDEAADSSARADCLISVLSRKAAQIAEHMTTKGVTVKKQAKSADQKDEFVTGKVFRVSAQAADVIPSGLLCCPRPKCKLCSFSQPI